MQKLSSLSSKIDWNKKSNSPLTNVHCKGLQFFEDGCLAGPWIYQSNRQHTASKMSIILFPIICKKSEYRNHMAHEKHYCFMRKNACKIGWS